MVKGIEKIALREMRSSGAYGLVVLCSPIKSVAHDISAPRQQQTQNFKPVRPVGRKRRNE